ncbi:14647_t:CDS:2, partial [Dentiscutata erythropus]
MASFDFILTSFILLISNRFVMPCHGDTIVKINQVRQTCNDDSKLIAIRAVGVFPVESDDRELDLSLFIPMNDEERDPNSQSIFELNEYYCVGGKVVLGSYNGNLRLKMTVASSTHLAIKRDLGSNRCPLKVSLVGVAQDAPKEINNENAIINVLVNDYAGQVYSFTIKIIFPYCNSRFKHLMNSSRLNESVLFVVGQMEIIDKDLYVYAVDISFVDISSVTKKKVSVFENSPALYRSVRSRLLTIHQSINEDSFNVSEIKNSDLGKEKSEREVDLITEDSHVMKRTRLEDEKDDYVEYDEHDNKHKNESANMGNGYKDNIAYDSKGSGCSSEGSSKGKDKVIQSVVHNTRQRSELFKNVNSNDKV